MTENCIFCKIVKGEIPSAKVWEDDEILAFLDINPVNPGHTLVIPKVHCKEMSEVPGELLSKLFIKSQKLMGDIKETMKADYVILSVAGVDISHFHIHLIPRYFNDGMASFWPTKKYAEKEAESVAEKLKKNMNNKG